MDLNLGGKVAWVVGATGTLGEAIALALAGEGARLALSARSEEALAACAARIKAATGAEALIVPADVTDPDSVAHATERIVSQCARLEILVNSVTVPVFGDFLEIDRDTFSAALDTKYFGYLACLKAAIPYMIAQRDGRIVSITGTGGKHPITTHLPGGSANAALNLVTKGLATQYGCHNVRINALSPGRIQSPRQAQMAAAAPGEDPTKNIPLGRFGEPEEVADAVLFLVSDRARYITGEVLQLDGGAIPSM